MLTRETPRLPGLPKRRVNECRLGTPLNGGCSCDDPEAGAPLPALQQPKRALELPKDYSQPAAPRQEPTDFDPA
jgi:hypothetical protein